MQQVCCVCMQPFCRREIIDSKFYKHLLSVMSGASKHLPNTSSGAAGHCHADQDTEMQASTATHACNDASTASASASAHVSPSLASWSCIQQMVVYGLGSVEDSRVSKYQVGAMSCRIIGCSREYGTVPTWPCGPMCPRVAMCKGRLVNAVWHVQCAVVHHAALWLWHSEMHT